MAYPYHQYNTYQQPMPQYQMQPAQQYQMQPQQQNPQANIIVRPVASIEEARAMQTDFSGAMVIMPDTAHEQIYTKQLNYNTGSADWCIYRRMQEQPQQESLPQSVDLSGYVRREDFDLLCTQFKALVDQLGGNSNDAPAGNSV